MQSHWAVILGTVKLYITLYNLYKMGQKLQNQKNFEKMKTDLTTAAVYVADSNTVTGKCDGRRLPK